MIRLSRHTRISAACMVMTALCVAGCDWGSPSDLLRSLRLPGPEWKARVKNVYTTELLCNLSAAFARLEVDSVSIRSQLFPEERTREIHIELPRGRPLEETVWLLSDAARRTPYSLTDGVRGSGATAFTLQFDSRRSGQEHVRITATWATRYHSRSGAVAFLVRDFGFTPTQTTNELLSFSEPLSVALHAHEDKSGWTARIAEQYHKEIIIQLPMENKTGASPGPNPLMVHLPEDRIAATLISLSRNIPNFSGFCNAGGSRVLEDTRATRAILSQVKRLHGYFVDDKTAPLSLVPHIAAQVQCSYRQVDGRIDDAASPTAIDEYLRNLVHRAHKSASVLISAPATAAFAGALTRSRELFASHGIRFAYVSDILVHPEN